MNSDHTNEEMSTNIILQIKLTVTTTTLTNVKMTLCKSTKKLS